jgi:hypothetical protein
MTFSLFRGCTRKSIFVTCDDLQKELLIPLKFFLKALTQWYVSAFTHQWAHEAQIFAETYLMFICCVRMLWHDPSEIPTTLVKSRIVICLSSWKTSLIKFTFSYILLLNGHSEHSALLADITWVLKNQSSAWVQIIVSSLKAGFNIWQVSVAWFGGEFNAHGCSLQYAIFW